MSANPGPFSYAFGPCPYAFRPCPYAFRPCPYAFGLFPMHLDLVPMRLALVPMRFGLLSLCVSAFVPASVRCRPFPIRLAYFKRRRVPMRHWQIREARGVGRVFAEARPQRSPIPVWHIAAYTCCQRESEAESRVKFFRDIGLELKPDFMKPYPAPSHSAIAPRSFVCCGVDSTGKKFDPWPSHATGRPLFAPRGTANSPPEIHAALGP